jgi:hypothetical protein
MIRGTCSVCVPHHSLALNPCLVGAGDVLPTSQNFAKVNIMRANISSHLAQSSHEFTLTQRDRCNS